MHVVSCDQESLATIYSLQQCKHTKVSNLFVRAFEKLKMSQENV